MDAKIWVTAELSIEFLEKFNSDKWKEIDALYAELAKESPRRAQAWYSIIFAPRATAMKIVRLAEMSDDGRVLVDSVSMSNFHSAIARNEIDIFDGIASELKWRRERRKSEESFDVRRAKEMSMANEARRNAEKRELEREAAERAKNADTMFPFFMLVISMIAVVIVYTIYNS